MTCRCVRGFGNQKCLPYLSIAKTLALVFACLTRPAQANQDYTAWQEITVLTVSKLEAAATNCRLTINGEKLGVLLASAGLSLDAIRIRPRSSDLQQQIDANAAEFRTNREFACANALAAFGPEADPGVRGLLQQ